MKDASFRTASGPAGGSGLSGAWRCCRTELRAQRLSQQVNVAWTGYIHERIRGAGGGAAIVKRRRDLILEMSNHPDRERARP